MSNLISRADAIEAVRIIADKMTEHGKVCMEQAVSILEALPSAELPKGDLISRADVLKYPIRLNHYDEENGSREFVYGVESVIEYVESLPSADAEPIVIRAQTFMRKEDYDKWAEDIKKQNKSIVCIPCDAEVVSADADRPHGEWIEKYYDADDRGPSHYVCSECRNVWNKAFIPFTWHYCPSCGARMKGGDDE